MKATEENHLKLNKSVQDIKSLYTELNAARKILKDQKIS